MPKFRIILDSDNSAFENRNFEIARILNDIANKILNDNECGIIRDINGNSIGKYGFCPNYNKL